jgi:DNA replication protein DnaC
LRATTKAFFDPEEAMETDLENLGLKSALGSVTTRTQKAAENSERLTPAEKSRQEGLHKWLALQQRLGQRYAECKLSNFELYEDEEHKREQMKVIDSLRTYGEHMEKFVGRGSGIILFGPAGTGKDHLLAAMMAHACWHNLNVAWRNGMSLYAERRDAIHAERLERELIQELTLPDVLAISDPVPPWGTLTDGQVEFLFRVVDARYRQCKPIWMTANFTEGKEAESRIGNQIVDRLRDGALALHCNWPSFRKAGL